MDVERSFSCYSCGRETECLRGEPLSEGLKGWITLAYWRETGEVSHYAFCSYGCLKSWINSVVTPIPHVFLESFGEDEK